MSYLERIRGELAALDAHALLRIPRQNVPSGAIDFSSNDYLGLSRDARVVASFRETDAVGSGGSRLLAGAHPAYAALEEDLAVWMGRERALLFSSGYLAALGAIVTLAPSFDVAFSDALVHACAIDALRLTKLPRRIYPHATVPEANGVDGAAMIVTESVFGMDGSVARLDALLRALGKRGVLVVDEAHALGVTGAHGAGAVAEFDDERIVIVGTLSKAVGAAGGFVAGPADAIALFASTARAFVYDTAPPPAIAAAARTALTIVRGDEGDALRDRLASNARRMRDGLRESAFDVSESDSPIVPLIVGGQREALGLARELELRGIFAPAIRPPTVPSSTSRLRITVRADHTAADVDALICAVGDARLARR